ncbi:hypothetical protein BDY17DRAFT_305440 [Neohortaea acidophila]|uniref:FAD-binding FR-type domain-containing protein n=1 Tax=Neohortaea acidophila TaxID=245834 RepID=A0A6A6PF56_9PEZI|nr:uncharacterized protein BDY17DRAFT_305440 [Neohortaea acidophila]KAF2478580.1 hypothetical protein BDY17DRAFT_305440 [Neohortaea acidophila]
MFERKPHRFRPLGAPSSRRPACALHKLLSMSASMHGDVSRLTKKPTATRQSASPQKRHRVVEDHALAPPLQPVMFPCGRQPCRRSIPSASSAALILTRPSRNAAAATLSSSPARRALSQRPRCESDGHEGRARRAAIRPITLFALCIPLGYVLSYAINTRQDAGQTDGFVKYVLVRKEEVSSTCSIFTVRPSTASILRSADALSSRQSITSVQFKQPQLQIARSYTILPPLQDQDAGELRFLIRQERNGEVSGYLHRLTVGAEVQLRGLSAEYVLPEKVSRVVFLAGGTGIAPAMQVADALAGQADVHILWASRRREDCVGGRSDGNPAGVQDSLFTKVKGLFGVSQLSVQPHDSTRGPSLIVAQVEALKQRANTRRPGSLQVDYYVDEEATLIEFKDVAPLLRKGSQPSSDSEGKDLLFVAGPEGFVNHWAFRKIWVNGQEVQGPVGGALAKMDLTGWEVVKL